MEILTGIHKDIEFNEQFAYAYNLLENSAQNLFITGKAGTGKSTLLQYFRDHTSKKVVVLAPTGVAAVNVKGQTIHSFFKFKPDITSEGVHSIRIRKKQQKIFREIDAIVIDEVSMVRADLLDCVDTFLKIYGKKSNEPFGGIQMIFFGDLYQLSPVVPRHDRAIFNTVYKSPFFFDAHCYKDINIEIIELHKIYRQKEEKFIRFLSMIRNKTADHDDIKYLNDRLLPNFVPPTGEFYIYLTSTNALADQVNLFQLKALGSDLHYCEGDITGKFDTKCLPTQLTLGIKDGAQVMLLNNDPGGRWINGTIGKITFIPKEGLARNPVEVELEDGRRVEVMPFTWEMFRFSYNEELQALESESVGSFKQYPLRLAWAVTIHKSQGKTFSKVIIDIGRGAFSHGQIYVALSRCTSYQGLILKRPIQEKDVLLDSRIIEFMGNKEDDSNRQLVNNKE